MHNANPIVSTAEQPAEELRSDPWLREFPNWAAFCFLAALTLAMFAGTLFGGAALSHVDHDLSMQFVHWRQFGFEQLRDGNLALWNPHIFSGAPYFAGFQSALLYPPNLLFLILALPQAINWSIALHVFLAGAFTFLWVRQRGLHPLACVLSAVMFMFSGSYFLHIHAGHLPNLCAMVWAPLLFLAIDKLFAGPSLAACLLGAFAVAMQILAGHPQYVYYTAIAAGIYCALCLVKAGQRKRVLIGLAVIPIGGAALSAVQLLSGLEASGESLRSGGLSYDFAAMFSFPPENFLTLIVPWFFGGLKGLPYWGRCYIWEMSLFMSVSGLALAVYGAAAGERAKRNYSLAMAGVLLVLALGARTPLFDLLHQFLPMFDSFRGSSKFIFLATLFLAMVAGVGLDQIIRKKLQTRWLCRLCVVMAVLLGAVAGIVYVVASGTDFNVWWHKLPAAIESTGEAYFRAEYASAPEFARQAGHYAVKMLLLGTATFSGLALLAFAARFSRRAALGFLGVALVELFFFAHGSLARFDLSAAIPAQVTKHIAEHPGDYRILNVTNPNSAMSIGAFDIWGYDPGVPRRYGEFMAFTQGVSPEEATQYIRFSGMHRLYAMLRCQFAFVPNRIGELQIVEAGDAMDRLELIQEYRVLTERAEIFTVMADASFDPRRQVLLEQEPVPPPVPTSQQGSARIIDASTDHLTVEADLPAPAILLITDSYSKGWRARALPGSGQLEYQLLPANYCLRAVPLDAGHHRIRIEYLPAGFVVGKWISLFALAIFLIAGVAALRRRAHAP